MGSMRVGEAGAWSTPAPPGSAHMPFDVVGAVKGSRKHRTRGSHTPSQVACHVVPTRQRPGPPHAGRRSDATASIGQGEPPVRPANQAPPRGPAARSRNPSRCDEPSLPPKLYVSHPPVSTLHATEKTHESKAHLLGRNITSCEIFFSLKAPESFHGFRHRLHLVAPRRPSRCQR